MIKSILLVCWVLLCSGFIFGQYDYFKWPKTASSLSSAVISPSSGITTDIFNRLYYIDHSSKKITGIYGYALATAPIARSNSNLVYINNPTLGDALYYIGSNHKIYALRYSSTINNWVLDNQYASIADNVAPNSTIDVRTHEQIYYVRSGDLRVCDYWQNPFGSGYGPLNMTAATARSNTNIVHRDGEVYYISGTSNLARLKFNGSTWVSTNFSNDLIAANSKIQISDLGPNLMHVFYVRAIDNRLASYWVNGSLSGSTVCDDKSVPVAQNSEIKVSNDGSEVYYLGQDGNFHVLYWDNCRWVDNELNKNASGNANYPFFSLHNDEELVYFDGSHLQQLEKPSPNANFIYRKSTHLEKNGSNWDAKIVDYVVNIYRRNGDIFIGPSGHYDNTLFDWVCLSDPACNTVLNNHFANIQNAGFNAIRFNDLMVECGTANSLATPNVDPTLYVKIWDIPNNYPSTSLPAVATTVPVESVKTELFEEFTKLVNKAGSYGLKVNFFSGLAHGHMNYNTVTHQTYKNYLGDLASNFANNPNILMYSLMLEVDAYPSAYEMITNKNYICSITEQWYNEIRENDMNHLVSIGVISPASTQTWDPGVLNVDVLTYHVYPDMGQGYGNYDYEFFYQQLKWFSNIMYDKVRKPWIVGETGIPSVADPTTYPTPTSTPFDLLVDYDEQRDFGIMSMQNAFEAGASGYGWWQYRDVYAYDNNYGIYFGLVDRNGNNKDIIENNNSIFNTVSVVNGCNNSTAPTDYYNHFNSYQYSLSGYVKNTNGTPISDAYIYTYASCTGKQYYTFSDGLGYFLLKSECPITSVDVLGVAKNSIRVILPKNARTYSMSDINCLAVKSAEVAENDNVMEVEDHVLDADAGLDLKYSELVIYPNPTSGIIRFGGEAFGDFDAVLYDARGMYVATYENVNSRDQIDLSAFGSGMYLLELEWQNGTKEIRRISLNTTNK